MGTIRSPLGAVGAILVALEAVFGGTLFALDTASGLRVAIVVTMIAVFISVTAVVLWMVVYLTIKNPGFLFNPAEVARLSETARRGIYAIPSSRISLEPQILDLTNRETGNLSAQSSADLSDEPDRTDDRPSP